MAFRFFKSRLISPRQERLQALSLFVDLTPGELAIVDDLFHERDYLAKETIFDQGDEGEALYIVLDGEVLICRQGLGEAGRLAQIAPGTFFGELALLDNAPRAAQAVAATNCKLAVFFREDFMGLLDTHARIASKIARQLAHHVAQRMREMALAAEAYQHL